MRFPRKSMAIAILLLLAVAYCPSTLFADDTSGELDQALSQMDRWLGKSDQGPGWHRYLRTEELRSEIAKGNVASRQLVGQILAKYESGAKGLNDYHFANVTKALAAWRNESLLPAIAELPDLALAAEFSEKTDSDVAKSRKRVNRDSQTLGNWLDRHGDNGQRWKSYLNFADLETELAKDEPDTAKLEAVVRQFAGDKNGLEMPKYLAVWDSLRSYIDTYQAANNPQVKERYQQQAKVLAKLLQELPEKSTFRERDAIGQRLAFFERMGQADTLVRAARGHHSHPNFSGYVSEGVLAAGTHRQVNQTKKGIRDSILGTSLIINAETNAEVTADVVANDQQAEFQMLLTGVISTDAVGTNRGVTIYTEGESQIEAQKAFYIDENGLSADATTAKAKSNNRITGLSAKRKFIERIAWRKIGQQKGAAERIGARKTEQRVGEEMDREAESLLADADEKFNEGFREPLVRRAAFPKILDFSSTDDAIQLTMLQASSRQLGAPTLLPPLAVENDLGVRLHESLINNYASTLYSGRTLTSEEVEKESKNSPLLQRFREKQDAKRKARGEAEPEDKQEDANWAITFARRNPVTVEFNDGNVRLTIRATRFEGDGPIQERNMSIWVVYKFELAANQGLKLVLQEWDVIPTSVENGGRIKPADEPLRQKLKTRFKKLFTDVELDPLELPGQFEKAGLLAYKKVAADNGWFSLALDRMNTAVAANESTLTSTKTDDHAEASTKR